MISRIDNVLSDKELGQIHKVFESVDFISGKATASGMAAMAKDNLQLSQDDTRAQPIMKLVLDALARNQQFYMACYPGQVYPPLFNRYEAGMSYGNHVDDSIMRSPKPMRTDIAVTLFLSDTESYDGGELVILMPGGGEHRIKFPAGSLVTYPSASLHRVEPVTRGVRYAAVTWVESLVRDPARRVVLSDLDRTVFQLKDKLPNSAELNTLINTYHTLMRMWFQT